MGTHFNTFGIIVEEVLLSRHSFFKMLGNRRCSLITVIMTFSINTLDTWYHLLKEGFIKEQIKSGSCLILPFFLETIQWSNSEPKCSSYALRMCFFFLVPFIMIASSKAFGSEGLRIWSFVVGTQVGAKMLFAWRALMLAAVGAGGAFLLDSLVPAVGSIFLWIGFITKLLCNLLLMSIRKFCNVWIGWASIGGEEGTGPIYQKYATQSNTRDGLFGMSCAE